MIEPPVYAIVINGASSAGKSTLARALQEVFPLPLLKFGFDVFIDGEVLPRRALRDGRAEWRQMRPAVTAGYHGCITALLAAGNHLVIDHVVESEDDARRLRGAVAVADTFYVGLHCDLEELERRERARGDRPIGDARNDADRVHRFCTYDLELHDAASVGEHAAAVVAAWAAAHPTA